MKYKNMLLKKGKNVMSKKLASFRLRREIIKMLDILSRDLRLTKTDIIESLVEEYFLMKKNRAKLK